MVISVAVFIFGFFVLQISPTPQIRWPGDTVLDKIVLLRAVFPDAKMRQLEEYCVAEDSKRRLEVKRASQHVPLFSARAYFWECAEAKERMHAAEAFFTRMRQKYNAYSNFDVLAAYAVPFSLCVNSLSYVRQRCEDVLDGLQWLTQPPAEQQHNDDVNARADALLRSLTEAICFVQHRTLTRMRTHDRTQKEPLPTAERIVVDELSVFKLYEQMWHEWERRRQAGAEASAGEQPPSAGVGPIFLRPNVIWPKRGILENSQQQKNADRLRIWENPLANKST